MDPQFQIQTSHGALRYTDTTVDTSMAGNAVTVDVETATGITNPLWFVPPFGPLFARGSLTRHVDRRTLDPVAAGPLHDAVAALHELGARHGITGVSDHHAPGRILVRHSGDAFFDLPRGLTGADRLQLQDAARAVLDLVEQS